MSISPKYFALAAGKSSNDDERAALARLEAMAAELAIIERDFPSVIAARRAGRQQAPVKLSKDQRAFVDGADADLAASEREQLGLLKDLPSAVEIVEVLSMVVSGAPADWSFLRPASHEQDQPLVDDVVRRQRALRAEMQAYLDTFGGGDGSSTSSTSSGGDGAR